MDLQRIREESQEAVEQACDRHNRALFWISLQDVRLNLIPKGQVSQQSSEDKGNAAHQVSRTNDSVHAPPGSILYLVADGKNVLLAGEGENKDGQSLPKSKRVSSHHRNEARPVAGQILVIVTGVELLSGSDRVERNEHGGPNNDDNRTHRSTFQLADVLKAREASCNGKPKQDDLPAVQRSKAQRLKGRGGEVADDDKVGGRDPEALYHDRTVDKPRPSGRHCVGDRIEAAWRLANPSCGALQQVAAQGRAKGKDEQEDQS
mmetsp:Transcript_63001/g.147945  ORF Transcript_63001/g.147945 Transcript_63001/m.147945 type:complete len:262 (-) Transcript_63001:290-1075(-)